MKYPSGIKKENNKIINYGNRGMSLEYDLNETNRYYLENNIAIIYKKPTPIQVNKVNYPSRYEAVITEAYYKTPSTTDYNGLYRGKYIDFEAKETKSKTSFPLQNIHEHQIKHIRRIIEHNGVSFIIVKFTLLDKVFFLKGSDLIYYIDNTTKKTITIDYFNKNGYLIKYKIHPRLDYIKIIDEIYGGNL